MSVGMFSVKLQVTANDRHTERDYSFLGCTAVLFCKRIPIRHLLLPCSSYGECDEYSSVGW
jgi:hypothetical protein